MSSDSDPSVLNLLASTTTIANTVDIRIQEVLAKESTALLKEHKLVTRSAKTELRLVSTAPSALRGELRKLAGLLRSWIEEVVPQTSFVNGLGREPDLSEEHLRGSFEFVHPETRSMSIVNVIADPSVPRYAAMLNRRLRALGIESIYVSYRSFSPDTSYPYPGETLPCPRAALYISQAPDVAAGSRRLAINSHKLGMASLPYLIPDIKKILMTLSRKSLVATPHARNLRRSRTGVREVVPAAAPQPAPASATA